MAARRRRPAVKGNGIVPPRSVDPLIAARVRCESRLRDAPLVIIERFHQRAKAHIAALMR